MASAGKYKWRMKRQSAIAGGSGFLDTGDYFWACLEDTKSEIENEIGTSVFQTVVEITLRNYIELNAGDRLIDTETDDIYVIHGIQRNRKEHETVVLAERSLWGRTV